MLRFLVRGPFSWLAVLDMAEPSAGSDMLLSLGRWGGYWLGDGIPQPEEHPASTMTVTEDFLVTLEPGVSLDDRFRVERFAQWQQSHPTFVYQITQRSLKRAAEGGVSSVRIAGFLRQRARNSAPRVLAAIERFAAAEPSQPA